MSALFRATFFHRLGNGEEVRDSRRSRRPSRFFGSTRCGEEQMPRTDYRSRFVLSLDSDSPGTGTGEAGSNAWLLSYIAVTLARRVPTADAALPFCLCTVHVQSPTLGSPQHTNVHSEPGLWLPLETGQEKSRRTSRPLVRRRTRNRRLTVREVVSAQATKQARIETSPRGALCPCPTSGERYLGPSLCVSSVPPLRGAWPQPRQDTLATSPRSHSRPHHHQLSLPTSYCICSILILYPSQVNFCWTTESSPSHGKAPQLQPAPAHQSPISTTTESQDRAAKLGAGIQRQGSL